MKTKTNYPTTIDSMSDDDKLKFHLSVEIDFNLNALIGKFKHIASLCTTKEDMESLSSELRDIHNHIDTYFDKFQTDTHYENIAEESPFRDC